MKSGSLTLVRHGESRLNEMNRFSGWLDIPLSRHGVNEARTLAEHCSNTQYTAAFTSHLERAHETLLVILSRQKKIAIFGHENDKRYNNLSKVPKTFLSHLTHVYAGKALNERMYGDLEGLVKTEAEKRYGKEQVFQWRRGFSQRPPNGESLKDIYERVVPYFESEIHPLVKAGGTVLLVAHGNTLRALIKYFETISDEQIPFVDLPTAHPFIYNYKKGKYQRKHGEYDFMRPLR